MHAVFRLALGLAFVAPVLSGQAGSGPHEADYVIRDFRFTSGAVLPELRIHYVTLGQPRRDADGIVRNAVLILHGTTGNGRAFLGRGFAGELFGPGQPLDTATHFVILPDGIGTGRSSKPSDGLKGRFPVYGYDDMVTAQYRLLTEGLGVNHLRLVMGTSMGGMHTWVWGYRYPGFVDGLVPLASVPTQIAGRNRMMRQMMADAIRQDPDYRDGEYTTTPGGLRTALGMLFMMTSSPLTQQRQAPTRDSAETYITNWMRQRLASTDANDFLWQFEASRDYDPSPHLDRITAPVLAINSADDLVNPPELGLMERLMPRVARGRYVLLPVTPETRGHGTHSLPAIWKHELVDFLRTLPPLPPAPEYDLLIRRGTVIDGSGRARFQADVAVRGDRIVRVSPAPIDPAAATRVIDATGLIVAPGFIDLHAHLEPLPTMPDAQSHVRQGVTLAVGGPDGGGPSPFGDYVRTLETRPLGMNVAFLAGHNTIRRRVMGTADRAPSPAELARMQTFVAEAMREGAFGLSTGLRYVPGFYSALDEVVALARVAADSGGIYTSHLREEGVGLIGGVAEALEIGRRAQIPVVLTHHKAVGRLMWGKSVVTLAMVDSARRAGTDAMIDQYPYTASSTSLDVLVPPWALAGGDSALRRRLADPVLKDSITRGVIEYLLNDRGGGELWRVQFARVAWDPSLNGRNLHDLVVREGLEPTVENAAPVVLAAVLRGGASMIYHIIDEADVKRIMAHPVTMIASDGRLTWPGDGVPHPRAYGTFPRVLGKYVRDDGVLPLETAVHKMTALPATRLGLADRGCVREACVADITIFDAARVRERGTFDDPHHYPEGIPWVIVNGIPVVADGQFIDARPGRVLKRPAGRVRGSIPPV